MQIGHVYKYIPTCTHMQAMLHPLELMSLVVGQQVFEWTELERVSRNMHVYPFALSSANRELCSTLQSGRDSSL